MSEWYRKDDGAESARISALIRKDDDPELFEFIRGIPYGRTSSYIKAALYLYMESGAVPELPKPPPGPRRRRERMDPAVESENVSQKSYRPAPPPPASRPAMPPAMAPPQVAHADDEEDGVLNPEDEEILRQMNARFASE